MDDNNDFSFAPGVPGKERIRIMLLARGASLSDFALKEGVCKDRGGDIHHPSEVSMCLSGTREYPAIRQDLADFLGRERAEIDRHIDHADPAQRTA